MELLWRMAQDLGPVRQAGGIYVQKINLSSKIHVKLEIKALCIKRHLKWKPLYIQVILCRKGAAFIAS